MSIPRKYNLYSLLSSLDSKESKPFHLNPLLVMRITMDVYMILMSLTPKTGSRACDEPHFGMFSVSDDATRCERRSRPLRAADWRMTLLTRLQRRN